MLRRGFIVSTTTSGSAASVAVTSNETLSPSATVLDDLRIIPVYSTATRSIKTFNQRRMKVLSKPDEFIFYQRMSNDPLKQSGVQFLTHFSKHQRLHCREREAMVDHLHWGKTNGQAWAPHRFQRVAFDFNDEVHPTKVFSAGGGSQHTLWLGANESAAAAGSSMSTYSGATSTSFDPHEPVWNDATDRNARYTNRHPQQADFKFDSNFRTGSMLQEYIRDHGVTSPTPREFGFDETLDKANGGLPGGKLPGLNAPYLGEPDKGLMEAMAMPALRDDSLADKNSVCVNIGRYSKSIYINVPDRNNVLRGPVCRDLSLIIDQQVNGMRTKLVVLKAAQCGKTEAFCGGLDVEELAHNMRMREKALLTVKELRQKLVDAGNSNGNKSFASKRIDAATQRLLVEAEDYLLVSDRALRDGFCLLWRLFSAQRPLLTIINGTCHNIGNGIALLPKYAGLRDSTELVHDGAQTGLTPFGGMTHLLARTETTLKYPGLAEFVMLTGSPLYSGDALRLGWSDLFSTLPDLDRHIRVWFDESEHMHNDAVTWQIGHLLETCFHGKGGSGGTTGSNNPGDGHESTTGMERCALTPVRARWVEDIFADQPSVEAVMQTLSQVEKLPLTDPNNTTDVNFSASSHHNVSVDFAVEKLRSTKMHFSVAPWDVIDAPSFNNSEIVSVGEIFRSYYFEQTPNSGLNVAARHDTDKLMKWSKFRRSEFEAFQKHRAAVHPRHVFARVSGCESHLLTDFEFNFESSGMEAVRASMPLSSANAGGREEEEQLVEVERETTMMVRSLKRAILAKLNMPEGRSIELQWSLPTLDNAVVCNDAELLRLLHADPGTDDPQRPTRFPPIYFTIVRRRLHFSEWAYSVKHQLLLSSPFALKASFALLRAVRGQDGTEEQVRSVSESLALEFRYVSKMMQRRDFAAIGAPSCWSADKWAEIRRSQEEPTARELDDVNKSETTGNDGEIGVSVDASLYPVVPVVKHSDVFERVVEIDGHRFPLRPRWEPRTLAEVDDASIAELGAPLSFEQYRVTELNVPTETNHGRRITETVFDYMGYEVVPGLGETTTAAVTESSPSKSKTATPSAVTSAAAAALKSDAYVPNNINFYEMARHPWKDQASSWRSHGFTDNSWSYFNKKYEEAVKKVHDPENRGAHEYWPSRHQAQKRKNSSSSRAGDDNDADLEPEEILLRDRFWGAIKQAETQVDSWARDARALAASHALPAASSVATGVGRRQPVQSSTKLRYPVEPTTPEEKIFDDEYYRWFIRPGHHPNPSGIFKGGVGLSGGAAAKKGKKSAEKSDE